MPSGREAQDVMTGCVADRGGCAIGRLERDSSQRLTGLEVADCSFDRDPLVSRLPGVAHGIDLVLRRGTHVSSKGKIGETIRRDGCLLGQEEPFGQLRAQPLAGCQDQVVGIARDSDVRRLQGGAQQAFRLHPLDINAHSHGIHQARITQHTEWGLLFDQAHQFNHRPILQPCVNAVRLLSAQRCART